MIQTLLSAYENVFQPRAPDMSTVPLRDFTPQQADAIYRWASIRDAGATWDGGIKSAAHADFDRRFQDLEPHNQLMQLNIWFLEMPCADGLPEMVRQIKLVAAQVYGPQSPPTAVASA